MYVKKETEAVMQTQIHGTPLEGWLALYDINEHLGCLLLCAGEEERGCLSVLGQCIQVSASSVQESVGRRRGGCQNDSVDNRWKDRDTGTVDGNNPWGRSGTSSTRLLGTEQLRVIIGDQHTNGERTEDVEEQNTPEHTADGLWDVLAGVLCFTGGHSHHLHTTIRERSIDKSGEESQESSGGSSTDIGLHGTGVMPVSESQASLFWRTTEIDDEREDQETDDCDDLDTSEDEFRFTIDRNGEDVETEDDSDDDGDPCGNIDIPSTVPELNDNRGSRYFGAKSDGA
jgi:hypothetical protein